MNEILILILVAIAGFVAGMMLKDKVLALFRKSS